MNRHVKRDWGDGKAYVSWCQKHSSDSVWKASTLLAGCLLVKSFKERRLLVSVSPSMHLISGPSGDIHISPQTAEENNSAPVLLFLLSFLNFQCGNLAADLLGFLKRSAVHSQSMLMLCRSPKWFAYGFFWECEGSVYVCANLSAAPELSPLREWQCCSFSRKY